MYMTTWLHDYICHGEVKHQRNWDMPHGCNLCVHVIQIYTDYTDYIPYTCHAHVMHMYILYMYTHTTKVTYTYITKGHIKKKKKDHIHIHIHVHVQQKVLTTWSSCPLRTFNLGEVLISSFLQFHSIRCLMTYIYKYKEHNYRHNGDSFKCCD